MRITLIGWILSNDRFPIRLLPMTNGLRLTFRDEFNIFAKSGKSVKMVKINGQRIEGFFQ